MKLLLVMFFLFFVSTDIVASDTLKLDTNKAYYEFFSGKNSFRTFTDSSNSLLINQIVQSDSLFKSESLPRGRKSSSYSLWIKFYVQNLADDSWVFAQDDGTIGEMEFYQRRNNQWFKQSWGRELGQSNKSFKAFNPVFQLFTQKGEVKEIFIKIKSNRGFGYQFRVSSLKESIEIATNYSIFLGLLYGIVFIMLLYNLVFFFTTRGLLHLHYCFFLIAIIYTNLNGNLGPLLFWPNYPSFSHHSDALTVILLAVTMQVYILSFLDFWQYKKSVLGILAFNLVFVSLVLIENYYFKSYLYYPNYLIIFSLLLLFITIWSYYNGNKSARFVLMGLIFINLGQFFFLAIAREWLPANVFTIHSFYFGSILEILMFSVALGDRVRILKRQKELASHQLLIQLRENEQIKNTNYLQLERLVDQRTQHLNEAYDKLKEHNVDLEHDLKEISIERTFQATLSFNEFTQTYLNDDYCLQFLSNLKWKDGYKCKKCSNLKYTNITVELARKCTRCKYAEYPMSNTIFQHLKFSLQKAFYLLYISYSNKGDVNSNELSRILDLRQKTCWEFLNKVAGFYDFDDKRHFSSPNGWVSWILVK